MMTREHHRRRSPDISRRRRKERRDSREQLQTRQTPVPLPIVRYEERAEEPVDLQSRAFSPLSSSSSTSSSLLNISRPSRFGLGNFFGGGRKQHRVKKKRNRFLRFGNSSSSSVGSDLAYGKGYIERRRSREFSPPNNAGRPALSQRGRAQTDEEIIELGRKFAEIARQQNAEDLRAAGRSRPSGLISAASALSQFRRTNSGHSNRGVGSSKPRPDDSSDDSEWESASDDDDSSSSEFDSGLAYGSGLSLQSTVKVERAIDPPRPSHSPRSPPTVRSPRSILRSPASLLAPSRDSPLHRKPSVVDPTLFGPVNSLRGYVEAPCGFEKVDRSKLDEPHRPYEPSIPPSEAISDTRPLQRVYPVPTSDPDRFDARGSVVSFQHDAPISSPSSRSSRPRPVPIQQPKPIAPVSRKVLDAVETESRFSDRSSSRKSIGEAAIAGVAGVALGAALSSDRRDDRERYEEKRERERERERDGKRRSKRSDIGALDEKAEKRRSRDVTRDEPRDEPREDREDREDRSEKRREKRPEQERDSEKDTRLRQMIATEAERESEKEKRRRDEYRDEGNDYDRERRERRERRDARNDDRKNEREIDRNETRREERASRSDLQTYKRQKDSGYQPKEGSIDPFQFQVSDDAFQTPLYTTPKRPLTPNIVTVDREPDFSRFERMEDDTRSLERLSRKDSYERDLRKAHDIYEATEHATAPVNGAAFAAATATLLAEERRGRSHSRGSDASSRNRSRRGESPERKKDAVQEDADRYYREAELARRIQEEDQRSHSPVQSSVIDKWKEAKEPVVVDIIAPPEMDHPKKKSPYDGPDADVRIDNVLEHPSELARFRTPDIKGLSTALIFKTRDPSAERERPMLNVVRPTPVPTPTLEIRRLLEEIPSKAVTENDTSGPRDIPDVVIGPRGEIIAAPPTAKAVSWGENQTKHYVVESPEREDDPYSGTKIVTPAKPPRSRSGRKNGWGVIAAASSGTSVGAAPSSTTDPSIDSEATRTERAARDGEKTTSRRSSTQLEGMYDSPPVPGPKPPSPRSVHMPGAFAEDPAFTANIAAALQGSGFDPNIVIDNASFHRRDSPPGSNETDVYHSPFVESVIDLGSTAPQIGQEHGFVIGEVPETPTEERDIPADRSNILSRLKELRRQQSAAGQGGPQGPEIFNDAVKSRSTAEDDWDSPSSKLSKKEKKRHENSASAQSTEEGVLADDDASRTEQDLEAEFGVAAADEGEEHSSKKKKSKKSKKAIVVQDSSKQPETESPKVDPADSFQDVRSTKATESTKDKTTEEDADWDFPKESRRKSKRNSEAYESARAALASGLSMESSYRITDAESAPVTDDEWDTPKTSRRNSGAYSTLSRSAPSEISLELARRSTLPASLSDDERDVLSKKKGKRNTIDDEFSALARSTDDLSRTTSRRSSRAYDSPSRGEPSDGDLVESPVEIGESLSNLRSEKTVATEEDGDMTLKKSKKKSKQSSAVYDDTPSTPISQTAPSEISATSSRRSKHDSYTDSPSKPALGSEIGTDDSRKKKKKKKRRSTDGLLDDGNSEPPDRGRDRFEALDRDVSSIVSDPSRYDDRKSSRSRRNDIMDDTRSVTSTPGSADRKDRKSSKSEKDARNSGNSSFFDRFKSSIGVAGEGRPRKSEEDKKNSFLDNAGTLGAGVGSTGAALAPVSQEARSNATNQPLEEETQTVPITPERQSTRSREVEFIDPEIVPREIRPAIDPKYGDLLPLPPSLPGSPVPELGDEFPPLPDSRPESPEHERHLLEMPTHVRRRSGIETPHRPKTPSQGAIPLQFLLGHKATPESPSTSFRSPSVRSPSASPITGISEFSERRRRPRPTSWESSREFKPLLLLQRAFRESNMVSSPERDSSPSERLQEISPDRSEDHEDTSPSSSRIRTESPGLTSQPRQGVSEALARLTAAEVSEAPATSRAAETTSHFSDDGVSKQPSDEVLQRQAPPVDDSPHLPPLLESNEIPAPENQRVIAEHEDFQKPLEQLPSEFLERTESRSPKPDLKLVVPSSEINLLPRAIQRPDANVLPVSPILAVEQKGTEPDESFKNSLEDNFMDVTPVVETAKPVPGDIQVMSMLDNRGSSQETEVVALQSKEMPSSDLLPEDKAPAWADALESSENDAAENGLVELSSFLETLYDDDNAPLEGEIEVKEMPEIPAHVETPSVQDDTLFSDAVTEQIPALELFQEPVVEEPAAVETLMTETPEVSEPALQRALIAEKSVEVPLSEEPAPENHREPLPEELQKEIVDVPQPEPEFLNVQETPSASSKKGKKKKKKSKSQASIPTLDDQPVVTETRDASLRELPSQPTEIIIAPAERESSTIENKPHLIEEPTTIEKEFASEETTNTAGPEASTVESTPAEKEPVVKEKLLATEEPTTIEKEFAAVEKPASLAQEASTVEPATVDKEPLADKNPAISGSDPSTVEQTPIEKELTVEEEPLATEYATIEKESNAEKLVPSKLEIPSVESATVKKELSGEEKATTSKPEGSTIEPVVDEPSSSAWSFWGATKKPIKKPKEVPQTTTADSNDSWLNWGKKKLKGAASDAPVETKKERVPDTVVSKSIATEKEDSTAKTETPIFQLDAFTAEPDAPSTGPEQSMADLDASTPQHEPSTLRLEPTPVEPELDPVQQLEQESTVADVITLGIEAVPVSLKPQTTIELEPTPIEQDTTLVKPEPEIVNVAASTIESEFAPVELEPKDISTVESKTMAEPESTSTETEPAVSRLEAPSAEAKPHMESQAQPLGELQAESTITDPETLATKAEPATVESEAREIFTIEPEPTTAEPKPTITIELEPASLETVGEQESVAEPEVLVESDAIARPDQTALKKELAATDVEVPSAEKGTTIVNPEQAVVEADSTMDEAESIPTEQELVTATEEPVIAEEVKLEQTQTAPEASVVVSKKGKKKKKKGKQQSSLEEELAEPSTPQEESSKSNELTLEDKPENPDALPAELPVPTQDQPEVADAAIVQGQPDAQPVLPEETPSTTKKSKKKKKGKKAQNQEPEPEAEAAIAETSIEQAPAQEQISQPLPEAAAPVPTVQEVETAIQADNQTSDNAPGHLVEVPADYQDTEVKLNTRPGDRLISEEVPSGEPSKPADTSRDFEETPQENPSSGRLFEPLLSNPETDEAHELQSTLVPDIGQGQQTDPSLEPILGEDQLRSDTSQPEDLVVASVVQEDPNNGQEHEGEPTLVGATSEDPVEQEPSGSKPLEHIADDESPLEPNLPGGEDPGEQDPAATDPPKTPLSGAISIENLETTEQQIEAVEESTAPNVVTDDAQPLSLTTEPVAEEPQEMALPLEDTVGKKKKAKKNKKKRHDTSEAAESPVVTETPEEPVPQATSPEAILDEPVTKDVPEQPTQESTELPGDDLLQEPTATIETPKDEQEDSKAIDKIEEPEALKSEKPLNEPQVDAEIAQESVAEQVEPAGDVVESKVESPSKKSKKKKGKKNRQSISDSPLTAEPETSKSAEEPATEETAERAAGDDNQSTEAIAVSPAEIDVAADDQLETNQAPEAEVETVPSEKSKKGKQRSSAQLEPTASEEVPQEPLDNLVVQGDTNSEAAPQTESTIDVDPATGDKQVTQEEELEEPNSKKAKKGKKKKKQSQLSNDAEEIATPVSVPETLTEPITTSEALAPTPKEDSEPGRTITEAPKDDSKSVQFTEPLEEAPMEIPADIPINSAVEFPETDTTFNSDWASTDIPPPPDFSAQPETHQHEVPSGNSLKTHYEPPQDQSADPLDQLLATIKAEKQAEAPGDESDRTASQDVNDVAISAEQPLEKDAEALESAHGDEKKEQSIAEITPKDEGDIVRQLSEVVPPEQQSPNDQKFIEADLAKEPTAQDETQTTPVLVDQINTSTKADAAEVHQPQLEIRQPDDEAKANDETISRIEESTHGEPVIPEDIEPRDSAEPYEPTEPSAEPVPIPSTEDSALAAAEAEEESSAPAKKSKKDKKKKRKSKTQDALDSTAGTATPAEEPMIEPSSSQQIDTASTISPDQAESTHIVPDVPITTEPEELVPEPQAQQDEPQTSTTKKGKKDKKKKKASQTQEPEPGLSSFPTEETPTERPQSPLHGSSQLQTVASSELPLPQETEFQPLAREDGSDQPTQPIPETSETVIDASDMPTSVSQEPESQPTEPAYIPIQREDTEQERAIEVEKISGDAPIGDSVTVPEYREQKEMPQISDVAPIEKPIIEQKPGVEQERTTEQESAVQQSVPDEEPSETVATPQSKKDKKKKKKKRDNQAPPDDTATDPTQDISASASGTATLAEESKSVLDNAEPVASEDVSVLIEESEPIVESSELTASETPAVSQDITNPVPDVQPTVETRGFAEISSTPAEPLPDQPTSTAQATELDLQDSEKVFTEESKEGQDMEEATPAADDALQQTLKELVEETPATPAPLELAEVNDHIATGTSISEDTAEPVTAKKGKKNKKKKKSNASNDIQPQEEPAEVPQEMISDTQHAEPSTDLPEAISKDESIAEPELPKSEAGKEQEPLAVDDLQIQEKPAQAPLESTDNTRQEVASIPTQETSQDDEIRGLEPARDEEGQGEQSNVLDDVQKADAKPTVVPSADEPLEAEAQAPEDPKDENIDEVVPTKKGKKSKKKKRAGQVEDVSGEQQESTQTTSEPFAELVAESVAEPTVDTPAGKQVQTEQPAEAEISKDGDAQDAAPNKKSKKDKKKKKRATALEVEAEPNPEPPVEPEPSIELEQPIEPELSTDPELLTEPKSSTIAAADLSSEATRSDAPLTLEAVVPAEESPSTDPSELPPVPTSDNELPVASARDEATLAEESLPAEQPVQVIEEHIPEQPSENITAAPLASDTATADAAQPDVTQLDVDSQVADDQTKGTLLSESSRELEPLTLIGEPVQQGEESTIKSILPEEQETESTQLKESSIPEDRTPPEDTKLESLADQGESVQVQEPLKPKEPIQVDESLKLEEPSNLEEVAKVERATPGEEFTLAQEAAQTEEPLQAEEPATAEEPLQLEESLKPEEPLQPTEPTQTKQSSAVEEPVQREAPGHAEKFPEMDEFAQLEDIPKLDEARELDVTSTAGEISKPEEAAEADAPAQLEEPMQVSDSVSRELSENDPVKPDELLGSEEPTQREEPTQEEPPKLEEPVQSERPALVEESTQLEEPFQLAEQPPVVLDEPEIAPAKKSKKDKKKKKKASQAEPEPVPEPVPESAQQTGEPLVETSFPEQSRDHEVSRVLPEAVEGTPTVENPTSTSKDGENVETEETPAEVTTSKKSKKRKNRASQIMPEPTLETALPPEEPVELASLPEQPSVSEEPSQLEEPQPEEISQPEEILQPEEFGLPKQSSIPEHPEEHQNEEPQSMLERALPTEIVEQPPLPEQPQETQHDSQPVMESTPVSAADLAPTEEVAPGATMSKKSKKKKKRTSQLVPESVPESLLPIDEPTEQLSLSGQQYMPEQPPLRKQPQETQPEEPRPTTESAPLADVSAEESPLPEQPSLPEQSPLAEQPSVSEQTSLPEQSQEPQSQDTQPDAESTPVTSTNIAAEDSLAGPSTSKKSQKKKATQVDHDLEAEAPTPLETPNQPILLGESVVQEPLEQSDRQFEIEEPVAAEESFEVVPEAVPSKKSKKEKRKAKNSASTATEPEPEDNSTIKEESMAVEVEPSLPKQFSEQTNPTSEPAPLATEAASANPHVEHLKPSVAEVEAAFHPEKDQTVNATEKHKSEAIVHEDNTSTSLEQDLIHPDVKNEEIDTPLDNADLIIAQELRQPADVLSEINTKDAAKVDNKIKDELYFEVPDTALPTQDLVEAEKQDEPVASKEPITPKEPAQTELYDIAGPSKTPEIISTQQSEQMHADHPIQPDDLPSKDQELEPEAVPISRKKSKKNKKKKKADTQAESEPASGTQTPVTPKGISDESTETNTMKTMGGEPERTITNEGEWPKSLPKSKDTNRRTASGTSTPLESMEDAPVDAPPETVTEENIPGKQTLEDTSAVEGQSSKAKDVPEEKHSESKDQDQNAEDINISHPLKEDVTVSDNNQPASPAEEEQLVQPVEGPANEIAQDMPGHVELSVPVSPPRTPERAAPPPTINVDLSPAQPSGHVEHERPFDQSLQPEKKIKTKLSSDDTMIPVPLSAQDSIPPRIIDNLPYEAPKLFQPLEQATPQIEDNNVVPESLTPAREIAASYLEYQPIPTIDKQDIGKENEKAEMPSTSGLFPVITPGREIAAPYFEGHPTTVPTDDYDMLGDNSQEPSNTRPSTPSGGAPISPPGVESSQPEPEHVEDDTIPAQPDEKPRQPSPIQDTAPSAREVAAALMESHLKPSRKEEEASKEAEQIATEDISPMLHAEEATISPEKSEKGRKGKKTQKSVDKVSLDTDNVAIDEAPEGSSQSRELDGGGRLDTGTDDFRSAPSTEADDQARAAASPDAIKVVASNDVPERPAEQQGVTAKPEKVENVDIESPVVGREVQHELPKPRDAGHESPKSHEPPTSEIIEKLDDLDTSEHLTEPTGSTGERKSDDGTLKSISPTRSYLSSGRASPRVLPPVEEETKEDLEKERQNRSNQAGKITIAPEANRDSGVSTDSLHAKRRSFVDPAQRDSGVHLHDWPEKQDGLLQEERGAARTPQPNEKRTKKLGLGGEAPKLSTPTVRSQGDEVQVPVPVPVQDRLLDPQKTRPASRSSTPSSAAQEAGRRSVSDNLSISRRSTPLADRQLRRSTSNTSISRLRTPEPLRIRPESPGQSAFRSGTNTPPLSLRRVDKRMSGDLRSISSIGSTSSNLANNVERENLHHGHSQSQSQSQSQTTPVANEGRVRAKDMTDVYDGYGEGRIGSPRSPTRPHSMRRRQSMQVLELENRVEQLIAENRALADAKLHAEQSINHRSQQAHSAVAERDAEIESLKASLEWLQKEVTRLTEVNEGLNSANNVLALQHNEKYGRLESQYASTSKELDRHRSTRDQYHKTLEEKDAEIKKLRAQLEAVKEQVREMQRQILATKPPDADFLRLKDEDHFDHRCQQLCSHVQQWVLRFSKFSDMRACRLTNEINDEKIIDRLDNSVLDGSEVDDYLRDRVRRRDIFMSMTMNMIWEFVFTRYLFGMDREQRQKLKSLEKLLLDVGPPHAVRQWRAVTLTLLSKRPAFGDQRNQDTEAVVQAVFQTLCMILPPPSNLESQIQSQLRRVMREAVDLSIEMRTQRAEYMMLPPLQPEYDGNGDLARTVTFNAQLMNERSGDSTSNEDYEAQGAVVRTVLFPLVVKKGDDYGRGDDEIVICPAQVLVAKARHARMATPASEAGGVPLSRGTTPSVSLPAQSTVSLQMTDAPPPQPTPPHEADYI
ncbi:hypothetical protein GGR53DRAFT_79976 [Hypoxylon sp. FL1150]|nr:hypothetical protein GGR53DRAFT_79976 [Hypoxylon sp. FL1150]